MKSHVPGTEQYKETHGPGTGNTGYSNTTGSGDSYNRGNTGTGTGSYTGRDTGKPLFLCILLLLSMFVVCGRVHEVYSKYA